MVAPGKPTCRHPLRWTRERWGCIFQRAEKDNPGHCPSPLSRGAPAGPCSSVWQMMHPRRRRHLPFHQNRSLCFLPASWRTWQCANGWHGSPAHGTYAGYWHLSHGRVRTGTGAIAGFLTWPHHQLSPPRVECVRSPCQLPSLRQLNGWEKGI